VGGAERSARRKKQQQTAAGRKAVASARTGTDRTKIIIGVVVVVLLAGAVIGGVLYSNARKNQTAGQDIPVKSSAAANPVPDYPVTRDGVTVIEGKPDAKATVDFYEDFLCPVCREFEDTNASAIQAKIKDGSLQARYHMVIILNGRSDPPGYSLDAANAALCAADAGRFPAFHDSLYGKQPEEGARGYDNAQLTKLGTDLGITSPDFKSCVDSGKYKQQIQSANDQITSTPYLQQDFGNGQKGFGTPTVAIGQKVVDTNDPQWLNKLLSAS
jgi:protein-disulfide isomerase